MVCQPIQRVCRYPLLFAELLKFTPVCDCPHSHMEIEATLIRLREATAEINRATDDSRIKATLEKTWILQDRLVFPNQVCLYSPRATDADSLQARVSMPLPRTRSDHLDIYNSAALCTYAGRPKTASMVNTWLLCYTVTGCVSPLQAELIKYIQFKLA